MNSENFIKKNFIKNYFLFVGDDFYPQGGADDFESCFAALEEARDYADLMRKNGIRFDWAHVAELSDGDLDVVLSGRRRFKSNQAPYGLSNKLEWGWKEGREND